MTDVRPVRIQLSRKKGFDLQATSRALNGLPAVKVDRTTMYGNHAAARSGVTENTAAVKAFRDWIEAEASWSWLGRH